jgi:hypothetical protein
MKSISGQSYGEEENKSMGKYKDRNEGNERFVRVLKTATLHSRAVKAGLRGERAMSRASHSCIFVALTASRILSHSVVLTVT